MKNPKAAKHSWGMRKAWKKIRLAKKSGKKKVTCISSKPAPKEKCLYCRADLDNYGYPICNKCLQERITKEERRRYFPEE